MNAYYDALDELEREAKALLQKLEKAESVEVVNKIPWPEWVGWERCRSGSSWRWSKLILKLLINDLFISCVFHWLLIHSKPKLVTFSVFLIFQVVTFSVA